MPGSYAKISQFEKIFVLNLPSRSDRRDAMSLAASLTDIKVDYIDAISHADGVILPPGGADLRLNNETVNNWRTHLNAIRTSVHQDSSAALFATIVRGKPNTLADRVQDWSNAVSPRR